MYLPLTSTALLSPRESAVLSFIFSTRRCFTFFIAATEIYTDINMQCIHACTYTCTCTCTLSLFCTNFFRSEVPGQALAIYTVGEIHVPL